VNKFALMVRRTGFVPPPTKLSIEHTTVCNLHCENCARNIAVPVERHMPKEDIYSIVHGLPFLRTISFEGLGEAFCHPDMYEILHELKHFKTRVITNATLIEPDKLIGLRNLTVVISPYDKRQYEMAEKLVKNGTRVEFNAVLFPGCRVEEIGVNAKYSGVASVNYSHPQCFLPYIKHMDDMGTWPNVWHELEMLKRNLGLKMTYPPRRAKRTPCLYPWYIFRVNINGDVYPCSYLPQSKSGEFTERYLDSNIRVYQDEIKMGNVFEQSIKSIWRGEKWERLRTRMIHWDDIRKLDGEISNESLVIKRNVPTPYCFNCLHRWGKSC